MNKLFISYKITNANQSIQKRGKLSLSMCGFICAIFKFCREKYNCQELWHNLELILNKQNSLICYFLYGNNTLSGNNKINSNKEIERVLNHFILHNQIRMIAQNNRYSISHTTKPLFSRCTKQNITISTFRYNKYEIFKEISEHVIRIKTKFFDFKVGISILPNKQYKKSINRYFDGTYYFYLIGDFKCSDYIEYADKGLLFSLISSSVIRLTEDKIYALRENNYTKFSKSEIKKLIDLSFIHLSFKEKTWIELLSHRKRDKFGLTILTTTFCNARCPYCYQAGTKHGHMTEETANKVVEFIKKQNIQNFHITWFGGEPLLNPNALSYISKRLKENGISYKASMISNGYLVDKYIEKMTSEWMIKNIQITLDGIFDKYNSVKRFVNDDNAFNKVISNIHLLTEKGIKVSIRLNFDRNNYQNILECIEYIACEFANNNMVKVYANNIYGPKESYYLEDGTNLYYIVYKKLIENGLVQTVNDLRISLKPYHCFANNKNHFVINYNGDLCNCEHGVIDSSKYSFGTVYTNVTNEAKKQFWLNNEIPYAKCRSCKYFFLCRGGCKWDKTQTDYISYPCVWYKDLLEKLLNILYNK